MSNNIEPLAAALWFQRIAVIAAGDLGSAENSLRHASHLVQLAPVSYRKVLPSTINDDEFEQLLEAGSLEAAARKLFGPTTTMLIETGLADARSRAVVNCTLLDRTVEGVGGSAPIAMVNAWTNWLLSLRLEFGAELDAVRSSAEEGSVSECKSACPRAS